MALPAAHPSMIGVTLREPASSRTLGLVTRHGVALRPAAEIFHSHLRAALRARKRAT